MGVHYTASAPAVYHTPLIYSAHSGCTNNNGAIVPCALGSLLPVAAPVAPVAAAAAPAEEAAVEAVADRKKRDAEAEPEAEADPEAEPYLFYSTHGYFPVGYSHYAPLRYTYAPYTYAGHYGHYGLGHLGYFGRKKREAEPEADPEA